MERPRRRNSIVAALLGAGLALACLILVLRWRSASALPLLTEQSFQLALDQWSQAGPSDYSLAVHVDSAQPGHYTVEVRDHIARGATFNGQPFASTAALGTWSVPGMLENLRRDLDHLERARTYGDESHLLLRAEFDPHFGFPRQYERIDWGTQPPIRWTITDFQPTPPSN